MRWTKEARSERFTQSVHTRIVFAMKNISFALLLAFVGSLPACSSPQEATTAGATPSPTVTVPSEKPADPVTEKPKDDKPVGPEETPPPEEKPSAGRLALQQCTEGSRKVKGCTKEMNPVCAEVDTGIRCVRAPCPSTIQQTFSNACSACTDARVRGYWAISCEDMGKSTAP